MEFFRSVPVPVAPEQLIQALTIQALPRLCSLIGEATETTGVSGEIDCLWGHFRIHREVIRGGLRFTLPDCPNGLQWTVTAGFPPCPDGLVVHCTINRSEHEPELVESIDEFVDAWATGLAVLHSG